MEGIIIAIVVIFLLLMAIRFVFLFIEQFWAYILIIGVVGTGMYIVFRAIKEDIKSKRESEERRRQEEKRKQTEREEKKIRQNRYREQINKLCENSVLAYEELPKCVKSINECIDIAEKEFSERAFEPFWNAIEKALLHLKLFQDQVNCIDYSFKKYQEILRHYEGRPEKFPLVALEHKHSLSINETQRRLHNIVRKSQKDYEFTKIHLHRRTNSILLEGFGNLADALNGLSHNVERAIDGLSSNIRHAVKEYGDNSRRQMEELSTQQIYRLDKACEMLDNIQNRRKPTRSPWERPTRPNW